MMLAAKAAVNSYARSSTCTQRGTTSGCADHPRASRGLRSTGPGGVEPQRPRAPPSGQELMNTQSGLAHKVDDTATESAARRGGFTAQTVRFSDSTGAVRLPRCTLLPDHAPTVASPCGEQMPANAKYWMHCADTSKPTDPTPRFRSRDFWGKGAMKTLLGRGRAYLLALVVGSRLVVHCRNENGMSRGLLCSLTALSVHCLATYRNLLSVVSARYRDTATPPSSARRFFTLRSPAPALWYSVQTSPAHAQEESRESGCGIEHHESEIFLCSDEHSCDHGSRPL